MKILGFLWKGIDGLARAVIGLIAKISPKFGEKCLEIWNNTELTVPTPMEFEELEELATRFGKEA